MALPDILEVGNLTLEEGELRPADGSQSPVVPDTGLEKVDTCLEAAAFSLKFDIAELWRFGPDTTKRRGSSKARSGSSGSTGGAGGGGGKVPLKPYCEHVYTMPATLRTYTGRIMGMWTSGFDDSRAPQHHVLSPQVRRSQVEVTPVPSDPAVDQTAAGFYVCPSRSRYLIAA